MNRFVRFTGVAALVFAFFLSCDVTRMVGIDTADETAEGSAAGSADLLSFTFFSEDNPELEDDIDTLVAQSGVITAFLPSPVIAGATPLEARVELSNGASIHPNPQVARPYNQPVVYTVTAFDGSTREYEVRAQSRTATASATMIEYVLDAEDVENTELRSTVRATISGTTVFVELPYQPMQEDTLILNPTFSASEGASVSPVGPQDFKQPLSYTVEGADGSVTVYAVQVGISADTITRLVVNDPFYKESGNYIDLQPNIVSETSRHTIEVPPAIFDAFLDNEVGFNDFDFPAGASIDTTPLLRGEVPPYTVRVTSANGEWHADYEIAISRLTPFDTSIESGRIRVRPVFTRSTDRVRTAATITNTSIRDWRKSDRVVALGYDSGFDGDAPDSFPTASWTETGISLSLDSWSAWYGLGTRTQNLNVSNSSHSAWWGFDSGVNAARMSANQNVRNTVESNPDNRRLSSGAYTQGAKWVDIDITPGADTITWANRASGYSQSSTSSTFNRDHSLSLYYWMLYDDDGGSTTFRQHYGSLVSGVYRETYRDTTSYALRSHYQIEELQLTLAEYAWIEGVVEGPVSRGHSTSSSGFSQVVTFALPASTGNITGEIATFDVVAESGDRETYTISIGN